MIDDAIRAAFLGQFPPSAPIVVAAAETNFYAERALADPNLRVVPLDARLRGAISLDGATIVVDGLERLDDRLAALRALHDDAPRARAFSLVANGAHARTLAGYIDGSLDGSRHPFVRDDLPALFRESGWHVLDISPIPDASLLHHPALPILLRIGEVGIRLETVEQRDRVVTAGFVVVADAI